MSTVKRVLLAEQEQPVWPERMDLSGFGGVCGNHSPPGCNFMNRPRTPHDACWWSMLSCPFWLMYSQSLSWGGRTCTSVQSGRGMFLKRKSLSRPVKAGDAFLTTSLITDLHTATLSPITWKKVPDAKKPGVMRTGSFTDRPWTEAWAWQRWASNVLNACSSKAKASVRVFRGVLPQWIRKINMHP